MTDPRKCKIYECGTKQYYSTYYDENGNKVNKLNSWLYYDENNNLIEMPAVEKPNGDKYYFLNGLRHRDNNLPAIDCVNGEKRYYVNGLLHRDPYYDSNSQKVDLPAMVFANGDKHYYIHGILHRDNNLPAIEFKSGTKEYYVNGVLHRDYGLPAIEFANGSKNYYVNGNYHRISPYCDLNNKKGQLPAREFTIFDDTKSKRCIGYIEYWIHGKLHRDPYITSDGTKFDLPAVEFLDIDNKNMNEYYLDGIQYFPTEQTIKKPIELTIKLR